MVRSWSRAVGVGLFMATLAVASGDAQQPAPPPAQPAATARQQQPPPPVFRTGINFVRVDVIATDRTGQPVSNLQAQDFQVSEDGKPQTIEAFKLVKLDGGALQAADGPPRPIRNDDDEALEAGRDDVRLFGVFLDDYHVRRETSVAVRAPLEKFIQDQLGPSDMVGLMYPLQPVSSVRMSRDHEAIARAVGEFVGRKYEYTPRNSIEQQYAQASAETVESIRNSVSLSALKGLIVHMGTLKEGRKALIVVSEGFVAGLPPQLRDPIASAPGAGNADRNNPFAGMNDPNELRAQMGAMSDLSLRLREVWDAANRNNVALYAVDPRGLPASEFDLSQPSVAGSIDRQYLNASIDSLRLLAEQTDGKAFVGRNDLSAGINSIVRDTSAYYLIGYNSTQAPMDGKFHEIKVQIKRPGVQIRARKGYWALTPDDVAKATAPVRPEAPKAVEMALGAISQPALSRSPIRTWVGTSRGENGKTRVTFVWEPAARVAGDRDARADVPARVMLTAVAPDGSPSFRGRVPDAAAPPASAAPGAGPALVGSRVTFEVPPGRLQLRMSVEGSSSQVLDSDSREIAVPDLTAPRSQFGTPEVLRARTPRDYQQLKADLNAIPTVAREFVRTDRLLIRVPVYGAGATTPALSVHLLNRSGQAMSELPSMPSAASGPPVIDLPLAGLAAGEYIVEIKTVDGEATELVGFRITG